MSYAENVADWNCVHCSEPCRRGHDWRDAGNGRVAHNACADRARARCAATNTRGGEPTMIANNRKTIDELTAEVAGLVEQMESLGDAIEAALNSRLAASGKRLVRVEEDDPTAQLYAEPVPYHQQPAENESTTVLRRRLQEEEAALEGADSWAERTRIEENIASLRRQMGFSAFDRQIVNAEVVAVKRAPTTEAEFMAPATDAQTDPELIEKDIDRFERRTGQRR